METNHQQPGKLPEEVQEQIRQSAEAATDALDESLRKESRDYKSRIDKIYAYTHGYIDGATYGMEKWWEVKQELSELDHSHDALFQKYSALQEENEKLKAAIKHIRELANQGIFPHLPVETMGAQKCIEIDRYIVTEALASYGKEVGNG